MAEKRVIGKREFVDFPDLGLKHVDAKIDTGAYTTALHCHNIVLRKKDGQDILCFVPLGKDDPGPKKEICIQEFWTKVIRNSFGDSEERYLFKTRIKIGRKTINSVISLSDRGGMRYPVLIGRKLIKKRFIVDVEHEHLVRPVKSGKNPDQ
jgi:hypothetical protein